MYILLSLFSIFLFPSIALAVDMDYYTYGGFYPIVDAFKMIALVFSDDKYNVIFGVVIVVSIVAGIFRGIYTAFLTKNTSLFTWVAPVIIGVALHQSLIVPTGTLHIYDPMRNKYQAVSGIPNGLIIIAGGFNSIESGLVDMFNTASSVDYKSQAGGIGFDLLLGIGEQGIQMGDSYLRASMLNYTEECVFFEMQRTDGQIYMKDLEKNSNFIPIYANAVNPNIFTIYFEDKDGLCPDNPAHDYRQSGCTYSCTDAWAALQTKLQDPNTFEKGLRNRCAEAGFDPEIPADMLACKSKITDLASWLSNAAYTEVDVARQTSMAANFNDALMSYSPDAAAQALAARSTSATMIGMGVNAAKWVPALRATLTAVIIALIPFIIIFLVSPLWSKVVMLIIGFFILLCAWGVTDVVVHNLAMNEAYRTFDMLRESELGTETISMMGSLSLKSVASFSSYRQQGFMIATVLVTSLGLFSAYGITSFANNVMSATTSGAGAAGQEAYTPEGKGGSIKALEVAPVAMHNLMAYDYSKRVKAGVNKGAYEFGRDGAYGSQRIAGETGQRQTEASVVSSFGAMGHAEASNTTAGVAERAAKLQVDNTIGMSESMPIKQSALSQITGKDASQSDVFKFENLGNRFTQTSDGTMMVATPMGNTLAGGNLMSAQLQNYTLDSTTSRRDALISNASHSLSTNEEFAKTITSGTSKDKMSARETAFGESLRSSVETSLTKEIRDDKQFAERLAKETGDKAFAGAGVRLPKVLAVVSPITADAGYQVSYTTSDGKSHTATLSQSSGERLAKTQTSAVENTIRDSSRTQEGTQAAASYLNKIGAVESAQFVQSASKEQSMSESERLNANTAFVKFVGDKVYAHVGNLVERYDKAKIHIEQAAGDPDGKQYLDGKAKEFWQGASKSNITQQVETNMTEAKAEVTQDFDTTTNAVAPHTTSASQTINNVVVKSDARKPEKTAGPDVKGFENKNINKQLDIEHKKTDVQTQNAVVDAARDAGKKVPKIISEVMTKNNK